MSAKREMKIRSMTDADVEDVISLWQECGLTRPHNNPKQDLALARGKQNSDVLVGVLDQEIVASAMVGHDGHRGAVYYMSVVPSRQGQGYGQEILAAAEAWLRTRGAWKLNVMVRRENAVVQKFYNALGYEPEDRIVMSRWIDPSKRGC